MCIMGGCVSSGHFERRQQGNVFHVWNVDAFGEPVTPGHIEVTDSSLVLYQKSSREAIIWPMRSLRRYGFDAELFSFESGRRCTTGPGVYAFKCRKAEMLFNILQERILSSGQDELSNHSGATNQPPPLPLPMMTSTPLFPMPQPNSDAVDADNYLEPIVINRSNSNGSQQLPHNYVNDIGSYVNTEQVADQQNANILKSVPRNANAQSLDDETNYAKLDDLLKQEHQHLYMNVTVPADSENQPTTPPATTSADVDGQYSCDHCYANVAPATSLTKSLKQVSQNVHPQPQLHPVLSCPRQVNYAILDLRRRSRNNNNIHKAVNAMIDGTVAAGMGVPTLTSTATAVVAQSQSSTLCAPNAMSNNNSAILEGYAKIDFDKTTALSNSINPTLDDDQAVRKTRHNSNASSMLAKRTSLAIAESAE